MNTLSISIRLFFWFVSLDVLECFFFVREGIFYIYTHVNILEAKKGRRCYGHMAAFFSLPFRSSTVIQGCLQHQGQSSLVLLLDAGPGGTGMEDRSKEGDGENMGKYITKTHYDT